MLFMGLRSGAGGKPFLPPQGGAFLLPSRARATIKHKGIGQEQDAMPREVIAPHKGDKRYVRRGAKGRFSTKQVAVGRSLAADRRSKAKKTVKKGEGDRGDQKR
jgi:hypothetical protein